MFNRRQRLFVSGFQYRLLAAQVIHFIVIMLVFLSAVFIPVIVALGQGSPGDYSPAADQFLTLHKRVWPPLLLVLLLFILHSTLVVHRVAGPLFRMGQVMKEVEGGNLTIQARIRRSDYLHTEVAEMNRMIQALRGRVSDIEISAVEAAHALALIRDELGPAARGPEFARLEAAIAGVKPSVHGFVIEQAQSEEAQDRQDVGV